MADAERSEMTTPTPVGPYIPVARAGPFFVCSGQVGLVQSQSGPALADGGLGPQTRQAMANVGSVLAGVGCGWPDVFKTTVYLTDISGYAEFNAIYVETLGDHRPARSLVAVSALPVGALVEIEAWALAQPDQLP
jgi:2-iminobutanoate/2-iminopropanoate deaminase